MVNKKTHVTVVRADGEVETYDGFETPDGSDGRRYRYRLVGQRLDVVTQPVLSMPGDKWRLDVTYGERGWLRVGGFRLEDDAVVWYR